MMIIDFNTEITCLCGCGRPPNKGKKYIKGHYTRISNPGFKKGSVSWNKGLTKETDERVLKNSINLIGTHSNPPPREKRYADVFYEEDRIAKQKYKYESGFCQTSFQKDLRECVEDYLGKKVTDEQFSEIYYKAYEDGHAYGNHEIFSKLWNLMDLVEALLK